MMDRRRARDALAVPQGRRASPRRRPRARRPRHARRSAVSLSHPLRRSQPPPAHRVAEARADRVDRRPHPQLRPAIDAASRLQDLRRGCGRWDRVDLRVVAESAVSARRVRARPARRAVRRGRDARATAACSSRTRSTKSWTTRRARRFTPGGSCRCTKRPAASRRRFSASWCTTRCSGCRRICPISCPTTIRVRLGLPSRQAALLAAHFPPADAPLDALNRFETPAQRRLIFEEAFLFQTGVLARRRSARGRSASRR